MIHELKTEREYFEAVVKGEKTFEVRKDDRGFCEGDFLAINESENGETTGRCAIVQITYVLRAEEYCKKGFCILGITPCAIKSRYNFEFSDCWDHASANLPVYCEPIKAQKN